MWKIVIQIVYCHFSYMVSKPQKVSNEQTIPISTMSSTSGQIPIFNLNPWPLSSIDPSLIAFNINAQINKKLTPTTFPQWRAQCETLLIGYNLIEYVEDASSCPSSPDISTTALNKTHWVQKNKPILSTILASMSPRVIPLSYCKNLPWDLEEAQHFIC